MRNTVKAFLGASCCIAALMTAVPTLAADAKALKFDIPAGDLATALNQFAQQSDQQIFFPTEATRNKRARAVQGTYDREEALDLLLKGTGLSHKAGENDTIIVTNAGQRADAAAPAVRMAQTAQAEAGASADGPVRVEEIIVTARKRAESIRDVPISISAITAEEIERRGLFNAGDYLRGIAGVNQVEGGPFGQAIVIRGIETSPLSQNFNSGTTTATYFGETPTTNSAGMAGNSNVDIKTVDIERIEVLRGPQGTAFGSSSLGGAVRTIPVAPKLNVFEGRALAGYSRTAGTGGDNYNFQAVANIPLAEDKFAVRAVAYKYEDSGYYRNRAGSDPAFQTAVVNRFQVPGAFAIDQEEVGNYEVIGGRVAALFQANDDLQFTATYLTQRSETDGVPMANSGLYEQTLLQVATPQVRRGQTGGFYDTDIDLFNATMEYNLGWGSVLATYSHIDSQSANAFPFAYLGQANAAAGDAFSSHGEDVSEIRLTTDLEGPWNALVGLYYEELDDGKGDAFFQRFFWVGAPATNLYAPGGAPLVGTAADTRHHKQKAAFGEVSWELADNLTLTGGVRTYDYDRTRRYVTAGPFTGTANVNLAAGASGTNYRANLSYKIGEDALVYAGYSQGFRLGRPQIILAATCDRNNDGVIDGTSVPLASTGELNSDEVDSYEAGAKASLLDSRVSVDAAAFRMEWSGIPVTLTAPAAPTGCGLNYTINAGKAVSEGVEFQINAQLSDQVRLDFGGSRINARLSEDVPAAGLRQGNRLAGVPKVNANLGLQYEFALAGYDAFVRADSIYVGHFFGNILESPLTRAGGYIKIDTSFRVALDAVSIDLYAHNLMNENAFAFRRAGSNTQFFGHRLRPRTIGVNLTSTF